MHVKKVTDGYSDSDFSSQRSHLLKVCPNGVVHWKFAVCDGSKIIITTRKLWNKIVEFRSKKVADLLKSVLDHDKIYYIDVNEFCEAKTKIKVLRHDKSIHFKTKISIFILPDYNPNLII